jgi:hypothetical protein
MGLQFVGPVAEPVHNSCKDECVAEAWAVSISWPYARHQIGRGVPGYFSRGLARLIL